jgi:hypothetical protein
MTTSPFEVYSFRAESEYDAQRALTALGARGFHVRQLRSDASGATVEIGCRYSPREVVAILRQVPGGQMMLETVRRCPLSKNNLERSFESSPLDTEPEG